MRPYVPAGPPRFRHQIAGLQKMIATRGVCALLFDPGTGKTATTLDYLSVLALATNREVRVLVTAPLAAVDTWVSQARTYVHGDVAIWAEVLGGSIQQRTVELARRGPGGEPTNFRRSPIILMRDRTGTERLFRSASRKLPPEMLGGPRGGLMGTGPRLVIEVINLDAFSSRAQVGSLTTADLVVRAVKQFQPHVMVIDEAHRIKSPTSNVSRAVARLTPHVPRRLLLTGTVAPHSPLDIYAQWRFLEPNAFGYFTADGSRRPVSFTRFRDRYAVMGGWMGKEITGFDNLDEMQAVMAQNSIVARKTDVLDLPPVTDVVIDVDLGPAERRAYAEMVAKLATMLASGQLAEAKNRLAQLMKLRQITSGYLPDDSHLPEVIGDSKVRVVSSIVNDTLAGEDRVVVFVQFRHEIDRLTAALAVKGTEVVSITGDTKPAARQAIRERFGSDEKVRLILVAQIQTMSLAVNELVAASHVVFASLSQKRDDYEQARARLDRQGQTKPVTCWHALAPGTVDSVIFGNYRTRGDMESAILAHIKEES